jgi:hypothetical protein
MVIVRLMGGLGNQMFQYAAGRRLSLVRATELKLDLAFLLDRRPRENFVFRDYNLGIFNVKENFASPQETAPHTGNYANAFRRLVFKAQKAAGVKHRPYLRERYFHFDADLLNAPGNIYLDGYWQSEKYFQDVADVIRKDFAFKTPLLSSGSDISEIASQIQASGSVCLHVRRGDFVENPVTAQFHGFVGMGYINRAVATVAAKINQPRFFVFSDDIEWCRANIRLDYPTTVVGQADRGREFGNDFRLMTLCRHFIISNSAFGWWAAWLGGHPGKIVVAPEQWFASSPHSTRDLFPASWTII